MSGSIFAVVVVVACFLVGAICLATLISTHLISLQLRQSNCKSSHELATESSLDELASLAEIDDLLNEQDPYFGLQLAIALRDKARHFPIRVADVLEIREVLKTPDGQSDEQPNSQYNHLSKIIGRLESGYSAN